MDINISPEVSDALRSGRAVVALESTVIAHGLPFPENLETANACEQFVRNGGAVPATIAVFGGEICVGLETSQLERLANDKDTRKISMRDLAIGVARGLDCATTVATTTYIARAAGIRVFATGGIGGVHRGFSADVSGDLPVLASTPMTVVCSGAKIVLDLPATREWLETHGVAVLGWRTAEMPAFYSASSGLEVDQAVESAAEVAAVSKARDSLGLKGSVLVTVPVPFDFEIERDSLESMLDTLVQDAEEYGIRGKDLTPFLLSEMSARSAGRTLAANIALLKNNARVAAEIAVAIAEDR